jgi:phosphoenolpyruvate phosphomutase
MHDPDMSLVIRLRARPVAYFMEAHDGISAKIVAEAGFEGIWASGLAISSALGVRDCNEASWTQVAAVVEAICDAAARTPVLVDGDTGFGNYNNVRQFVRKISRIGAAGVCLEDKLFPKLNSLIGGSQPLVPIDEFCGKIKAAVDSRLNPDFCVVARTETLVVGDDVPEALARASAYADAGADAVMVHSAAASADHILDFARQWDGRLPLLIAPTTYHAALARVDLNRVAISGVIWANHNLRASIRAMQTIVRLIREFNDVQPVLDMIVDVKEVFRLFDYEELSSAASRYSPGSRKRES